MNAVDVRVNDVTIQFSWLNLSNGELQHMVMVGIEQNVLKYDATRGTPAATMVKSIDANKYGSMSPAISLRR
jgi:hypothetical protein